MRGLEYIWTWQEFLNPTETTQDLVELWSSIAHKVGIKPKYVLVPYDRAEFVKWLAKHKIKYWTEVGVVLIENDADLMYIKLVWS